MHAEWTGSVQIDACHIVIVTAVGSSGLRATYKSPKGVDCNPVQPVDRATSRAVALVLVHGVVRIGPATPVCRVGVPCDKPASHVVLRFTSGGAR